MKSRKSDVIIINPSLASQADQKDLKAPLNRRARVLWRALRVIQRHNDDTSRRAGKSVVAGCSASYRPTASSVTEGENRDHIAVAYLWQEFRRSRCRKQTVGWLDRPVTDAAVKLYNFSALIFEGFNRHIKGV